MAGGSGALALTKAFYPAVTGAVTGNWNSGVATSGLAGADFLTIGAAGIVTLLYDMLIRINGLTAAANITVRIFRQINGVERQVYGQTFVVGVDTDLWQISGQTAIDGVLRVEINSSAPADDGAAIPFEYMLEIV
jgi:hypothetical protein